MDPGPWIDPKALDLDRSLRDRLSRYAVERRAEDGGWTRIGLFGTAQEAAGTIDVDVAMQRGDPGDYRLKRVGFKRWVAMLGWATLALMVVATVAGWVALETN